MAAPLSLEPTEKSRVKILLVDDQPGKLLTYEAILQDLDEVMIKARSAKEAFDHLLRNDFAVVLIDVFMPEFDGFQLAAMIRGHPRFEKTPIIFISAVYLSDFDRLRGYESGAVDYVPVPVVPEILRAKVKVFVDLHRKTLELAKLNHELEKRVTERTAELQSSNEKLRESEARFRIASEAAEFGTYECNLRESRIYCSPQMRLLLGGVQDDTLDFERFLALVHPGDHGVVRRHILEPQGSDNRKRIEFRVTHQGGVRWLLDCGRASFEDQGGGAPARVIGTILDVTERKLVEERQLLLMAELDHRVKNILANVSAIAKLSSKRVSSVNDFVQSLDSRIQAISRAHSLLRRDSWIGIGLGDFVQELLAPFISRQGQNIRVEGDSVSLRPKAAQSLALALHELATNAVKYGALSVPDGQVHVTWTAASTNAPLDTVKLTWRETGGPTVREPAATGFGLMAIKAAAAELGVSLRLDFEETGAVFVFEGALGQAVPAIGPVPLRGNGTAFVIAGGEATDSKLRILIVEDEAVVGLQVKNDLEAAGHKVVGFATNVAQGVQLAGSTEIDVAFLDVRLGDDLSTPVAENLIRRGIPFAFGTGFEDESILPVHLRKIPRLIKPYETDAVSRLLASLSKVPGM